ncbi:helix-turn-helix transcriptional regulator [Paenibacillus sp. FSL H3-0457]|uniref:helix-turn-helix transcriptional regulator n=1 Tax=Paenibacillus sp. FSL H3-0457 TaxID=2921430 RepID=UPI0030EDDE74
MNSNNSSGTVCTLWTDRDSNNEEHRKKMKYIIKLDKLNQTEFSQIIGVSQGALNDLEKDKYKPSLETVVTLKEKFDVDLDSFLFDNVR